MKTKMLLFIIISVFSLVGQSVMADPPKLVSTFQGRVLEKGIPIGANNDPNVLTVGNIGGIIGTSPRYTEVKTLSYKEKPLSSTPVPGMKDGVLAESLFNTPYGLCVDANGDLIVVEGPSSNRIRKIDFTTDMVSFIAGDPGAGTADDFVGVGAFIDAKGINARFFNPAGAVCDAVGNIYVADRGNFRIRKIDKEGNVTTFAGTGESATVDGPRLEAQFKNPSGIVIDPLGNFYITDRSAHVVRKIDAEGNVTTFAGTVDVPGYADGTGTAIGLNSPQGIAIDSEGNIYVAEAKGNRVRKITPSGVSSTIAGDNTQVAGKSGVVDGQGTTATFNEPNGLAIDEYGYLYTSDFAGRKIRRISPKGFVKTLAGKGGTSFVDNAGGANAFFRGNNGIAYSKKHRRLYVADTGSNAIRFVSLTGYFSENLPAGMTMHMGTGSVYGTPTVLKSKTEVVWEGYNVDGGSFLSVPITVVNQGDLYYAVRSFVIGENGTISPFWESVDSEDVTFTIIPNEGYEIDTLKVNDELITPPVSEYVFKKVNSYNEISVSFKSIAGSIDNQKNVGFSIYPTLVSGNSFTVELGEGTTNLINIYDMVGKCVFTQSYNQMGAVLVEFPSLEAGIYFVEVKDKGVIRIIKQ